MTAKTQRTALVTGAGRRIGRAIALTLAEAGYAVALHANRAGAEAEALRDEIAGRGGRAAVVRADLSDHAAVAALVPAAAALAPLTLLVNNAAMFERDEIGSLDPDLFDRQLAINLRRRCFSPRRSPRRPPRMPMRRWSISWTSAC